MQFSWLSNRVPPNSRFLHHSKSFSNLCKILICKNYQFCDHLSVLYHFKPKENSSSQQKKLQKSKLHILSRSKTPKPNTSLNLQFKLTFNCSNLHLICKFLSSISLNSVSLPGINAVILRKHKPISTSN